MSLSIVVVGYGMDRELPRTLRSLGRAYQRQLEDVDYEVVLVDNGSPRPIHVDERDLAGGRLRLLRIEDAPSSPAAAANAGLAEATGDLVGLIIDGARIASPGLLSGALMASRLASRTVITAPGYHLGEVPHMQAPEVGYDQEAEDRLLDESGWERDGYRLFAVSTPAASSSRGWFAPMGESSSLFLPRLLWQELGGLDERFDLPGGGLVNHDLYRRACALPGAMLVSLLGEGTFHQLHGGAATSRQLTWDEMHAQYEALRGRRYEPPPNQAVQLGTVSPDALVHLADSAARALERAGTRR